MHFKFELIKYVHTSFLTVLICEIWKVWISFSSWFKQKILYQQKLFGKNWSRYKYSISFDSTTYSGSEIFTVCRHKEKHLLMKTWTSFLFLQIFSHSNYFLSADESKANLHIEALHEISQINIKKWCVYSKSAIPLQISH